MVHCLLYWCYNMESTTNSKSVNDVNLNDIFCKSNMNLIDDLLEQYDDMLRKNDDFNKVCHELSCDIDSIESMPNVKKIFNKFEVDCNQIYKYEACLLYLVGFKNGLNCDKV